MVFRPVERGTTLAGPTKGNAPGTMVTGMIETCHVDTVTMNSVFLGLKPPLHKTSAKV